MICLATLLRSLLALMATLYAVPLTCRPSVPPATVELAHLGS